MQFRKIHIIGGPGSGKTYLSKKLELISDLTAFDLDEVFWDQSQNSYIRATEEARDEKLNSIMSNKQWIIEGVYYKWLDESFRESDLIVILKTPLIKRQWRILKRFVLRKFFMGDFHKETFMSFIELWQWNSKFDRDNMVRIADFTSKYKEKIVYCSSYHDLKRVLNS